MNCLALLRTINLRTTNYSSTQNLVIVEHVVMRLINDVNNLLYRNEVPYFKETVYHLLN